MTDLTPESRELLFSLWDEQPQGIKDVRADQLRKIEAAARAPLQAQNAQLREALSEMLRTWRETPGQVEFSIAIHNADAALTGSKP